MKAIGSSKKWILGGIFLVVLAFLFVWISPKTILVSAIENRLLVLVQEITNQEATIGKVRLLLFPPSLVIQDVKVPAKNQEKNHDLLFVKEVSIFFSPFSYFTKLFVINRLEFKEPFLSALEKEGGISQLHQIVQKIFSSGEFPQRLRLPPINLKRFVIHQGDIRYETSDYSVHLPRVDLTAYSGLLQQTVNVQIQSVQPSFYWEGRQRSLDQIDAQFSVTSDTVNISRLDIELAQSHSIFKGQVKNLENPYVDLQVDAQIPLEAFSPLLLEAFPFSGDLRLISEIRGPFDELVGKGNFSMDSLVYKNESLGPLSVRFSYALNKNMFSVPEFQGEGFKGEFFGQFEFPFLKHASPLKMDFQLVHVDPSPILEYLFPKYGGLKKTVDATLSIQGEGFDLSSLEGRGTITALSSKPITQSKDHSPLIERKGLIRDLLLFSDRAHLDFMFSKGNTVISLGEFSTPGSKLILTGTVDQDLNMVLAYHLKSSHLEEILPFFRLKNFGGKSVLSGLLLGTPTQPGLHARLVVEALTYKGRAVGDLTSNLRFTDSLLDISSTFLEKGRSLYSFLGTLQIPKKTGLTEEGETGPIFDVKGNIHQGQLRDIIALFYKEIPVLGAADGEIKISGTPKDFKLEGAFDMGSGSAYGQSFDGGMVSVKLEKGRIIFEPFEFWRNESRLAGRGSISFADRTFTVDLTTESLEFEEIDLIHERFPYIEGNLAGVLKGKGSFRDPQITLNAGVTRFVYQGQGIGQGHIQGVLKGKDLNVETAFFENTLNLKGHVHLHTPFPYQFDLLLNDARIDPFLALAQPNLFESLPLKSTGSISGEGTFKPLSNMSFKVALSDMSLTLGEHLVKNKGDILLDFRDDILEIKSLKFQGEETTLSITGSLRPYKNYNLFIGGETDLSILSLFSREVVYAKGKAYLALRIFDDWKDPKIRGGFTSPGGTLRSETLGQSIKLHSLRFLFNENQVLLESLEGELGTGHLSGSGKLNIKNFKVEKFGLLLELKDVRLRVPDGLSSLMDGTLVFQGTEDSRDLKGDLFIKKARYHKKVEWKTWVTDFVKGKDQKEKTDIPLVGNTQLNLHILGKKNLWVDNNLAKFPFTVDLFLRGTINRPLILGRVEAREGSLFFRKNTFEIQKGSIDFINPESIRPIFDVQAETAVQNYTIDLSLAGGLDSFDLVLTSDPPLTDTDILSLLLIGKTAPELEEVQEDVGTIELLSLATGEVQEKFESQVEKMTGFDRIQVDPYYSGTRAAGGARLTVSEKFLEDDLVVTYSVTLNPSEEQTVLLEYLLDRNIFLVGRRDELGRMTGNIKFRFEFR